MIWARPLGSDAAPELELGLMRLGLPAAAREYILEKAPLAHVLLSGIGREEGRFLKDLQEGMMAPGHESFPAYLPGDVQRRPGTAMLSGRRDQFVSLEREARARPELLGLAGALQRWLSVNEPVPPTSLRHRTLSWGPEDPPRLIGVLNVTPDSFSDGGRFREVDAAVSHGLALVDAGADLLDVGAESTRPGAAPVSAEEELERLLPVMSALRARTEVPLSVDTTKARVAAAAVDAGAEVINDVSGLAFDPLMAEVIARTGVVCCLMHLKGEPRTMQQAPHYEDVVEEVLTGLERR